MVVNVQVCSYSAKIVELRVWKQRFRVFPYSGFPPSQKSEFME